MRAMVLVGVPILVLAVALMVLVGASDESMASFNLRHPATLGPIVANGLHNLTAGVRAWVAAAAADLRARLRPEEPAASPAE